MYFDLIIYLLKVCIDLDSPSPVVKQLSDIKSNKLVRSCSVNRCSGKMSGADTLDARMQFKSECELENIDFNKPLHFEHTVILKYLFVDIFLIVSKKKLYFSDVLF